MRFCCTWFAAHLHSILVLLTMLFMVFTSSASFGKPSVEMLIWSPEGDSSPAILIPKRSTQTEQQAVDHYLASLTTKIYKDSQYAGPADRLADLFKPEQLAHLRAEKPWQTFKALQTLDGIASVALIANSPDDMLGDERIVRNVKMFHALETQPIVIAMGADIGLSKVEQDNFREQIAEKFDLLVSLGGDDVDPRIYNEKPEGAVETNLERDIFELGLIKTFKARKKGFFFGICRGHQLGAIADGHSLKQDISHFPGANLGTHNPPDEDVHSDNVNTKGGAISQTIHDNILLGTSLLRTFLDVDGDHFNVNSIHHQAIHYNPEAQSKAIAMSVDDHIVEALEQTDGLGLSVQWHPEFFVIESMSDGFKTTMGKLMRGIVNHALQVSRSADRAQAKADGPKTCKAIFE